MKNKIIKEIFQTSKDSQPEYLRDQILSMANGWGYKHFTDEDIYKYFDENPMDEFPNIKNKFNEIPRGQHRADLFRYFYIYQNGGLFIDSDLSIEKNIDEIVGDCDIMTIISKIDKYAFNGLLYANKNNIVIYECLKHLYKIDISDLDHYNIVCEFLYQSLRRHHKEMSVTLNWWDHWDGHEFPHAMYNADKEVIVLHYWKTKVVPRKDINVSK